MIAIPSGHDGNGLKTPVGVGGEPGDGGPVVHPPPIPEGEVISKGPPGKGGIGPHLWITPGVVVQVVDAEEVGIFSFPGEP